MSKTENIIKKVILLIIVVSILIITYQYYEKNNFTEFVKSESSIGLSKFERDDKVKYSNYNSYKITNNEYNDAMFSKKINVNPNTVYRVKCKIKTENVKSENENTDTGAHICIGDTMEKSNNIIGTTDWTEVTFYFNSKNREQVEIGFRLGGYEGECKRNSMVFRFCN